MDWLSREGLSLQTFPDSSRFLSARVCLFVSTLLDTGDWPALWWPTAFSGPRCEEQDHSRDPQHLLYLLWIHFQQRPGAGQLEEASVFTGEHFFPFPLRTMLVIWRMRGENLKQLWWGVFNNVCFYQDKSTSKAAFDAYLTHCYAI